MSTIFITGEPANELRQSYINNSHEVELTHPFISGVGLNLENSMQSILLYRGMFLRLRLLCNVHGAILRIDFELLSLLSN
jgi:hypothetical protein